MKLNFPVEVDPKDFDYGVIVGRFQVHNLHEGHQALIDTVSSYHKKVIIFLGVPNAQGVDPNPMDFATRILMIKEKNPNVIVLPLEDQRFNDDWSRTLDNQIKITLGNKKALLYGSRDSFTKSYVGKHKTVELVAEKYYNGSDVRREVSKEVLASPEFRAGVIHSVAQARPVSLQTVDVAVMKKGEILLGRKPGEKKFRFVGGHVDVSDPSLEFAAKRELTEEAGSIETTDMKYVSSYRVDDWRYRRTTSKIMTALFVCDYIFGTIKADDDIVEVGWFNFADVDENSIMEEHIPLLLGLKVYLNIN